MTGNKRPGRSTAEHRPLWQRLIAGERLPKRLFRHPKCEGTIEDHRMIALDVRELIRKHVFDRPVGSAFDLNLAYPWLRVMRLNSSSLDLQLVTGRIVVVPLVWVSCGAMGERIRIECPLCGRRICILYCVDGRVACRRCNGLWYAAQRTSAKGRKFRAMKNVRCKLGDYGQLWAVEVPPKPRGMWRGSRVSDRRKGAWSRSVYQLSRRRQCVAQLRGRAGCLHRRTADSLRAMRAISR
jgi:hypothetical protein